MVTVKSILLEALNRSNLVPRKRVAPADMLESAFRLFRGILQSYNFSNFISFARDELEIIPTDEVIELAVDDINSISNVLYNYGDEWDELRFVSYEQFFQENKDYVYTWKYTTDNTIQVYIGKPVVGKIKIIFNKNLQYTLDDELHIPQVYEELFVCALAYKLSVVYPRTDSTQTQILKNELDEIEKIVKQNISSNKIITRDVCKQSNLSSFISGSFIGL